MPHTAARTETDNLPAWTICPTQQQEQKPTTYPPDQYAPHSSKNRNRQLTRLTNMLHTAARTETDNLPAWPICPTQQQEQKPTTYPPDQYAPHSSKNRNRQLTRLTNMPHTAARTETDNLPAWPICPTQQQEQKPTTYPPDQYAPHSSKNRNRQLIRLTNMLHTAARTETDNLPTWPICHTQQQEQKPKTYPPDQYAPHSSKNRNRQLTRLTNMPHTAARTETDNLPAWPICPTQQQEQKPTTYPPDQYAPHSSKNRNRQLIRLTNMLHTATRTETDNLPAWPICPTQQQEQKLTTYPPDQYAPHSSKNRNRQLTHLTNMPHTAARTETDNLSAWPICPTLQQEQKPTTYPPDQYAPHSNKNRNRQLTRLTNMPHTAARTETDNLSAWPICPTQQQEQKPTTYPPDQYAPHSSKNRNRQLTRLTNMPHTAARTETDNLPAWPICPTQQQEQKPTTYPPDQYAPHSSKNRNRQLTRLTNMPHTAARTETDNLPAWPICPTQQQEQKPTTYLPYQYAPHSSKNRNRQLTRLTNMPHTATRTETDNLPAWPICPTQQQEQKPTTYPPDQYAPHSNKNRNRQLTRLTNMPHTAARTETDNLPAWPICPTQQQEQKPTTYPPDQYDPHSSKNRNRQLIRLTNMPHTAARTETDNLPAWPICPTQQQEQKPTTYPPDQYAPHSSKNRNRQLTRLTNMPHTAARTETDNLPAWPICPTQQQEQKPTTYPPDQYAPHSSKNRNRQLTRLTNMPHTAARTETDNLPAWPICPTQQQEQKPTTYPPDQYAPHSSKNRNRQLTRLTNMPHTAARTETDNLPAWPICPTQQQEQKPTTYPPDQYAPHSSKNRNRQLTRLTNMPHTATRTETDNLPAWPICSTQQQEQKPTTYPPDQYAPHSSKNRNRQLTRLTNMPHTAARTETDNLPAWPICPTQQQEQKPTTYPPGQYAPHSSKNRNRQLTRLTNMPHTAAWTETDNLPAWPICPTQQQEQKPTTYPPDQYAPHSSKNRNRQLTHLTNMPHTAARTETDNLPTWPICPTQQQEQKPTTYPPDQYAPHSSMNRNRQLTRLTNMPHTAARTETDNLPAWPICPTQQQEQKPTTYPPDQYAPHSSKNRNRQLTRLTNMHHTAARTETDNLPAWPICPTQQQEHKPTTYPPDQYAPHSSKNRNRQLTRLTNMPHIAARTETDNLPAWPICPTQQQEQKLTTYPPDQYAPHSSKNRNRQLTRLTNMPHTATRTETDNLPAWPICPTQQQEQKPTTYLPDQYAPHSSKNRNWQLTRLTNMPHTAARTETDNLPAWPICPTQQQEQKPTTYPPDQYAPHSSKNRNRQLTRLTNMPHTAARTETDNLPAWPICPTQQQEQKPTTYPPDQYAPHCSKNRNRQLIRLTNMPHTATRTETDNLPAWPICPTQQQEQKPTTYPPDQYAPHSSKNRNRQLTRLTNMPHTAARTETDNLPAWPICPTQQQEQKPTTYPPDQYAPHSSKNRNRQLTRLTNMPHTAARTETDTLPAWPICPTQQQEQKPTTYPPDQYAPHSSKNRNRQLTRLTNMLHTAARTETDNLPAWPICSTQQQEHYCCERHCSWRTGSTSVHGH